MDNLPSKQFSMPFSVDFVRTIAILMVVFVHCSSFPYSIPGDPIASSLITVNWFSADFYGAIGYLGVPLFVMLSGALLLDPAKADESMSEFYKKRFNRIGIPLIFWTIVFFVWNYGVHGISLSFFNIEQGLLTGSYPIIWFLYLLVGLYLATPILRVLVKHIDRNKFLLLIILWFVGTTITPLIHTFTRFSYNPLMFVFTDWAGYYLLGMYLVGSKMSRKIVYPLIAGGLLVAIIGDWLITATMGQQLTGFFHGYLSFNMILASAALFLILVSIPKTKIESSNSNSVLNRVMHWIGQNTLPFYLLHIIVLETIQIGLLGFRFPYTGIVLVDAPALFVIAFTLSAVIIFCLKKIPFVNKLVG
jgi:surface polysaccharide O-acyltransferase-like enzyme